MLHLRNGGTDRLHSSGILLSQPQSRGSRIFFIKIMFRLSVVTIQSQHAFSLSKINYWLGWQYYTAEHLDENDEYEMFFHHDEPHLIRARIHSRFQSSVHHHLWIKYTAHVRYPSAITHYYCQCKSGERTAGCCSHLASVSSPHSYQFFTNYKDFFYD